MSPAMSPDGAAGDRLRAALVAKPDGVIETIAKDVGTTPRDVLEALGPQAARMIGPEHFEGVWSHLSGWGEVLFIVHTEDVVLEVTGSLPQGSAAHGWFNIHGDSPIGGHIRRTNCAGIALVDRQFHGRRSCSVWFMNEAGHAMFKVFVPRDENRALKPAELARFEELLGHFPG